MFYWITSARAAWLISMKNGNILPLNEWMNTRNRFTFLCENNTMSEGKSIVFLWSSHVDTMDRIGTTFYYMFYTGGGQTFYRECVNGSIIPIIFELGQTSATTQSTASPSIHNNNDNNKKKITNSNFLYSVQCTHCV